MSATAAERATEAARGNQGYQQQLGIWQRLKATGHGPWTVKQSSNTHDVLWELHELLRPNAPIKDPSLLSGIFQGLVRNGFILGKDVGGGRVEYSLAETPPEPDNRTWAERENEMLAKAHAEERARMDREYQAYQNAENMINDPVRQAEQGQILRVVNEAGFVRKAEVQAIVDAAVQAALANRS